MRQKLLITGFDPFGKETINPSWEAVSRLSDVIGDWELSKLKVPTEFGVAAEVVLKEAEAFMPDVIICVGQAGGRCAVMPEYVAINLRNASMADNRGNMPREESIRTDGPAAYFSTIPCSKIVDAVREAGIPGAISYSAGTYVCNDLFYSLRHRYEDTAVRVGFIHVPYLPAQTGSGCSLPSLPLDVIVQALSCAILAL